MPADVVVFAPAPQLTVTIEQPAEATELHLHPGGQGIWQSRMLASLGARVTMCASVGGEVGTVLESLMTAEGVDLHVVRRAAGSGWYVHDRRAGERHELAAAAGTPLSRHELDELYGMTLAAGLDADLSLLSGPADPSVIPPETYRRLASDLTNNGGRVVADLSGEHLNEVLQGGVCLLKVSHEELMADGRATADTTDALLRAAAQLLESGAESVIISRAARPALAVLQGKAYEVHLPRLETVEPKGAGDSMTAGAAAVLAQHGDLRKAVRVGAAAGALNVTRHGLGSGHAKAIMKLAEHIELRPIGSMGSGRDHD